MVSAEYGGTGGKPLEGGMIVEEPDIEIGQGVSSKGSSEFSAFSSPHLWGYPWPHFLPLPLPLPSSPPKFSHASR